MIPPTPTLIPPLPPSEMVFDIGDYLLWYFAPETIQRWNSLPGAVTVLLQAGILLFIVLTGYALFRRFLRNLANEATVTDDAGE